MKSPLFRCIASTLQAYNNCVEMSRNRHSPSHVEWSDKHAQTIEELTNEFMPSGSGIDSGCSFAFEESTPDRLVFHTSYHHMDESGGYDGWSEHKVIVTPSLTRAFDLKITGRDRNGIKEYLHETFQSALSDILEHTSEGYVSISRAESVARFKESVAKGETV